MKVKKKTKSCVCECPDIMYIHSYIHTCTWYPGYSMYPYTEGTSFFLACTVAMHTYIHMHTYICIHTYAYIHMHTYICIHTYAYIHHTYVCMYAYPVTYFFIYCMHYEYENYAYIFDSTRVLNFRCKCLIARSKAQHICYTCVSSLRCKCSKTSFVRRS
jgi:hypothetical protein